MHDAAIPIVGKAFEIISHYPTIVLQCQCDAGSILSLIGHNAVGKCDACGKVYAIGKVGKVEVGILRMDAPAPPDMAGLPEGAVTLVDDPGVVKES